MTEMAGETGEVTPHKPGGCRIVTTSTSARLLLSGQLAALDDYEWSVVCGDEYPDPPSGLTVHTIPMRRELAVSDVVSFWKLLRFFGQHRFDFVQTHTPKASLLALPAARLRGATALYTIHGSLYFRENRRVPNALGWLFERWCCAWAHRVLVQSAEDARELPAARICAEAKLIHIGNGISMERFTPPPEPGGQQRQPVVVMIGRLVAEKGCRDFFRVAQELRGQARFVHVGPQEHDQRDAIRPAELREAERAAVEFIGEVDDVRPHLARADVVLLPSYREGIPRVAMEACAMRRPVVGYDIRGMREVIPPTSGLLVPLKDVVALVALTRFLLVSPRERARRARECQEWVRSTFSERGVVERLRAVYAQVGAR